MLTKAASRVWALRVVMENNGGISVGSQFYITWITSLLEGCVAWEINKPAKRESESIENVQRKCFRNILRKGYTIFIRLVCAHTI